MNQATEVIDPVKPEPETPVAPSVSALPTPAVSGDTPQDSAAVMTRSFDPLSANPTAVVDLDLSVAPIGSVLDGYRLIEQIGRGGMGVVFRALQPNSDQVVALKLIRDGMLADPTSHDRFLQEVKAMGRLPSAKNIVPIYHVGHHRGGFFYVMPFLPGGPLSRQRDRFRKQPELVVALIEKIARAVHQMHLQNVLHRDIKPGNILLDADDEPYLCDFGLAKLLDHDQGLTATQQHPLDPPT